jgi:hypothetical protein
VDFSRVKDYNYSPTYEKYKDGDVHEESLSISTYQQVMGFGQVLSEDNTADVTSHGHQRSHVFRSFELY